VGTGAPGLSGVVGFVVAGGRSARMGRDKATLPWGKGDLLAHAAALLQSVTHDVRILCGPAPRYADRGWPIVTDVVADVGGLAALATALGQIGPGRTALLLAVDLPLVTGALLSHLAGTAASFDAVVPVSPAGAEPFCAAYGFACATPVERAIASGRLKMTSFWADVRVHDVRDAELQAFGDPARLFQNVNTPEEYARAQHQTCER
jgi:molybdopterin-guanine dinucleotide biosynthesis protein A